MNRKKIKFSSALDVPPTYESTTESIFDNDSIEIDETMSKSKNEIPVFSTDEIGQKSTSQKSPEPNISTLASEKHTQKTPEKLFTKKRKSYSVQYIQDIYLVNTYFSPSIFLSVVNVFLSMVWFMNIPNHKLLLWILIGFLLLSAISILYIMFSLHDTSGKILWIIYLLLIVALATVQVLKKYRKTLVKKILIIILSGINVITAIYFLKKRFLDQSDKMKFYWSG